MSKIFRASETKEIEYFLDTNEKVSFKLKDIILDELSQKTKRYSEGIIWLMTESEKMVIDVFNFKGEVFETETFYYKDFPNL